MMTSERRQQLKREADALLRRDGFRDIESPSGAVQAFASHGVSTKKTRELAQMTEDEELTNWMRYEQPWERKAWQLHLEGRSNRAIAVQLCLYRKLVDETFARLRKVARAKGRGRRKDPDSMRSHGVQLLVRLAPSHIAALDHVRTVLNVKGPEVLRRGLMEYARRISVLPRASRGQIDHGGDAR